MKSRSSLVVERREGRDVLTSAHVEPPYDVRPSGGRILLTASAAAPVGGDDVQVDVHVGPGAVARLGTVGATLVWPGPANEPSTTRFDATVLDRGHLEWRAEPTVSVQGSDHTSFTCIRLAGSATCRVVEETVLGRSGEVSGRLGVTLRVEREGRPLVHHEEWFGPDVEGAGSVVSIGTARHVLCAVLVGVVAGESRVWASGDSATRAAWLPVGVDTVVVLGAGPGRPDLLAALDAVAPELFSDPVRRREPAAGGARELAG